MEKPQYIIDAEGRKVSVVLSIQQYQELLDQVDDTYCQKLFDKAIELNEPEMPFDEYLKNRKRTSLND
ncbi:MAG: hypothetical protein K0S09_1624 [Sphingobacteriaceae bacterium]|jgi:hypothetical protein|nr:hypothetical protein [Sphingobacteriaceae bacterium]